MTKRIPDKAIAEALAEKFGIVGAAAHSLGISPATLARRLKANPKLARSAETEQIGKDVQALSEIYDAAMAGNLNAMKWWVKNQLGWTLPRARPLRTPQKIPFSPNAKVRLIEEEPDAAPAVTDVPGAELSKKRRSRS